MKRKRKVIAFVLVVFTSICVFARLALRSDYHDMSIAICPKFRYWPLCVSPRPIDHARDPERLMESKYPPSIFFVHFGVLHRARGCTNRINHENLYRAATLNFSVPHQHFGVFISTENSTIDGVQFHKTELEVLRNLGPEYSSLVELEVADVDRAVDSGCAEMTVANSTNTCTKPFWRDDYPMKNIRNALRQAYLEYQVAGLLQEKYFANSVVIALSTDVALLRPIKPEDVSHAYRASDVVYGTANNDGDGYTNGFYVGSASALVKTMSFFSNLRFFSEQGLKGTDYERLVKLSFEHNNISRVVLTGFGERYKDMIKWRANGGYFGEVSCEAVPLFSGACQRPTKLHCITRNQTHGL